MYILLRLYLSIFLSICDTYLIIFNICDALLIIIVRSSTMQATQKFKKTGRNKKVIPVKPISC